MNEDDLAAGPLRVLVRFFTGRPSLRAGLFSFFLVIAGDFIFQLLFPYYVDLLSYWNPKLALEDLDVVFAPIVWFVFATLILTSLTVVITFAAQNVPKLIDIYMEDFPSLAFTWWVLACSIHSFTIKPLFESGLRPYSSVIYNYHILLPLFVLIAFPFTMNILRSTKTSNVIVSLLSSSVSLLRRLNRAGLQKNISLENRKKHQYFLFETFNQLIDLLVYVPYKEPKAQIIEGIGELLREYVVLKQNIHPDFFQVSEAVSDDISFRTMKDLLGAVEESRTFYEQKALRLIGNTYNTFLDTGDFDLSTLCVEQLSRLGKSAIEAEDQPLMELITIRFNTHFRFAIKHGQQYNEPRNLYNLVFQYGLFVHHLLDFKKIDRVKTCFFYFTFYSGECFKFSRAAPSFAFILDVIGSEMQKILIRVYEEDWDEETFNALLEKFLLLDNPQGMDQEYQIQFFTKNVGLLLLRIGLGLYFFHKDAEELALRIVKDTLQDFELMGEKRFETVMNMVLMRLRFSGPKFWEDTDRGNGNMYYTPHQDQIDKFREKQLQLIAELNASKAQQKSEMEALV